MSVDQWNNRHQWLNQDTVAALSEEERQLFDDIQITYMTGKGNRVVPCLIPRDCVHAMDLLCSPDVRRAVHVADNNKHIFANYIIIIKHERMSMLVHAKGSLPVLGIT